MASIGDQADIDSRTAPHKACQWSFFLCIYASVSHRVGIARPANIDERRDCLSIILIILIYYRQANLMTGEAFLDPMGSISQLAELWFTWNVYKVSASSHGINEPHVIISLPQQQPPSFFCGFLDSFFHSIVHNILSLPWRIFPVPYSFVSLSLSELPTHGLEK